MVPEPGEGPEARNQADRRDVGRVTDLRRANARRVVGPSKQQDDGRVRIRARCGNFAIG